MIYIDKETLRRVNINYAYKGFSKLDSPELRERAGVVEVQEPPAPEDYADYLYYRTESDEAPYVQYTRKSGEQIWQYLDAQCTVKRAAAYQETDALFFKEQRGEVPIGTWVAAVAAVKEQFPRPIKPEIKDEQSNLP